MKEIRALPPTSQSLLDGETRPYFLWWTRASVGDLKAHLASHDPEERAYWMGALLREANTRDVWLFVSAEEIRAHCKNNLHDWKCPKEVVFVKELPRNTMGKVLKEEVKNIF